jgi:hypothetical protein
MSSRPGLELATVTGAAATAASDGLRLGQMKDIARRFSASEYAGPVRGRLQLRLMPRPLHRYAASAPGPRDGALFGFAYGTNPDVLLAIEAHEAEAGPGWWYGLARLGGGDFTVNLDGREVWNRPGADPPAERETYMNRWVAASDEAK